MSNALDEAARGRVARQEILHRPGKRFHFVLTEAALRYRLCPPDVMLSQLGQLQQGARRDYVRRRSYAWRHRVETDTAVRRRALSE